MHPLGSSWTAFSSSSLESSRASGCNIAIVWHSAILSRCIHHSRLFVLLGLVFTTRTLSTAFFAVTPAGAGSSLPVTLPNSALASSPLRCSSWRDITMRTILLAFSVLGCSSQSSAFCLPTCVEEPCAEVRPSVVGLIVTFTVRQRLASGARLTSQDRWLVRFAHLDARKDVLGLSDANWSFKMSSGLFNHNYIGFNYSILHKSSHSQCHLSELKSSFRQQVFPKRLLKFHFCLFP